MGMRHVTNKLQGEVKCPNVAQKARKRPCISYEKRIEIYNSLNEMTEEERREYFCGRKKLMNVSATSLRRIWREGETVSFLHPSRVVTQNYLTAKSMKSTLMLFCDMKLACHSPHAH